MTKARAGPTVVNMLDLEPGTLSKLTLETTPPDRVFGVAEFLQPDGSWHALRVLAFKPENDGYSYQIEGEGWGWLPASDVRGFVLAAPLPEVKSRARREAEFLEQNPGPHGSECFGGSDYPC